MPALKIDLYFSCWNNADILEFFFRHYDRFVRRYFAFDDGSVDGTLELLKTNSRVAVREMPRARLGEAHTLAALPLTETVWRETSSDADWVMICDVDEHLYHPDFEAYLARCKTEGITIVPALGYQMLADQLPTSGLLCEQVTRGAPFLKMSKLNLFDPNSIERLNYSPGRHRAAPIGDIVAPDRDELLLLHYKYLDFERVARRHAASAARLNHSDAENRWGHRWRFSREQLEQDWGAFERKAQDVMDDPAPWRSHPEPRWWERYRARREDGSIALVGLSR
jgi:hypothetical protein